VTKFNTVMSIIRCISVSVLRTIPYVNRITYGRTNNCYQKLKYIYCPYFELQLCGHCNNSRSVRIVTWYCVKCLHRARTRFIGSQTCRIKFRIQGRNAPWR